MTADALQTDLHAGALPLATRPVAFDGLCGWYSPGIGRRGVILCGTIGFEQLSAHRAWRALGERIAATGCATLRFDYPGEGDSGDAGAASLASWVGSIRRAIRFLREEAQVQEIVLVGLRLGGTLAAMAAQTERVDRLVLLAPFATGKAYLRELKLQSRSIGRLPDGAPIPQEPGTLTVGGFHIGDDLAAELGSIDIAACETPPSPHVLLVGGETTRLDARWSAMGCTVETLPFPGLAQLVANPLFAETPDDTFAAVARFATDGAPMGPGARFQASANARIVGEGWHEGPVRFGPDMFGILCRPAAPLDRAATVLFVNAGTNLRSGWGRQTTNLARKLASGGTPSFRIDLRGVGDSPDRPDREKPLFKPDTIDEVRAAIDVLEDRGAASIVIVGTCSGAHLAFHALCREPRLRGALAVNLYCFDWNPRDDVEAVIRNTFRSASTYAGLLRRKDAWRRLLTGEVRIAAILRALSSALGDRVTRRLALWTGRGPEGGSVARRIATLRRRGAHLRLLYSAGDRGLADLHAQLGPSMTRIAHRLGHPVAVVEEADHDLSTRVAQNRLEAELRDLLRAL